MAGFGRLVSGATRVHSRTSAVATSITMLRITHLSIRLGSCRRRQHSASAEISPALWSHKRNRHPSYYLPVVPLLVTSAPQSDLLSQRLSGFPGCLTCMQRACRTRYLARLPCFLSRLPSNHFPCSHPRLPRYAKSENKDSRLFWAYGIPSFRGPRR